MTIKNFKFTTESGNTFNIDAEIELFPSNGFTITKITKINGKEEDNIVLRNIIKHEDILQHIKNNNKVSC